MSCDLLSNSYLCSSCDSYAANHLQRSSCDLLSNSYLCSSCDSDLSCAESVRSVVICFQILTFAVAATVRMGRELSTLVL